MAYQYLLHHHQLGPTSDVFLGGAGVTPSNAFEIARNLVKNVGNAARELATVFYVTLF